MTTRQTQEMAHRVGAVLTEYVDQYILLAVPIDDPVNGVILTELSAARLAREDLENQLIAAAADILRRRKARTGG